MDQSDEFTSTGSKEPPLSENTYALLDELATSHIAPDGILKKNRGVNARKELLAVARALCFELETPIEAIFRMAWAEVGWNPQRLFGARCFYS